jgi:hypothetical protein
VYILQWDDRALELNNETYNPRNAIQSKVDAYKFLSYTSLVSSFRNDKLTLNLYDSIGGTFFQTHKRQH